MPASFAGALITGGAGTLTACGKAKGLETIKHLFWCDYDARLRAFATCLAGREMKPDRIYRNSTGSRIYMEQSGTPSERQILVVSSDQPPKILAPPSLNWELADDLTFVGSTGSCASISEMSSEPSGFSMIFTRVPRPT